MFLKDLCRSYGLDVSNISSHSLRIGGATSLIEMGIPPSVVKMIGRWVSDCYVAYIRVSDQSLRDAASALALAAKEKLAPVFCGMSHNEFSALSTGNINRFKRFRPK